MLRTRSIALLAPKKVTFQSIYAGNAAGTSSAREHFLSQLTGRLQRVRELAVKNLADPEHSRLVLIDSVKPVLLGERIPQGLLDRGEVHEQCGPMRAALVSECCACVHVLKLNLDGPFAKALAQCLVSDSLDAIRFMNGQAALEALMFLWDCLDRRPQNNSGGEAMAAGGGGGDGRRATKTSEAFVHTARRETILKLCDRITLLWKSRQQADDKSNREHSQPSLASPRMSFREFHKLVGILFHGDPSARLLVQFASTWFTPSDMDTSVENAAVAMITPFDATGELCDRKCLSKSMDKSLVFDVVDVVRLFNATLGESLQRSQQADPAAKNNSNGGGAVSQDEHRGRHNVAYLGSFFLGTIIGQAPIMRGNHLLTLAAGASKFSVCCPLFKASTAAHVPGEGGGGGSRDVYVREVVALSHRVQRHGGETHLLLSIKDVRCFYRRAIFLSANARAEQWLAGDHKVPSTAAGITAHSTRRSGSTDLFALAQCLEKHHQTGDAACSPFVLFDLRFGSSFPTLGTCFHGLALGIERDESSRRRDRKNVDEQRNSEDGNEGGGEAISSFDRKAFGLYLLALRNRSLLSSLDLKSLLTLSKVFRDEFVGLDLPEPLRLTLAAIESETCAQLMARRNFFIQDHGAVVAVSIAISTYSLSSCGEYLSLVKAVLPDIEHMAKMDPVEGLKLVALMCTAVASTRGTAELEAEARRCLERLTNNTICSHWARHFLSQARCSRQGCVRCSPMWLLGKYAVWLLKAHALLGMAPTHALLESISGPPAQLGRLCTVEANSALYWESETRLFDLARTVTNLHSPLSVLRTEDDKSRGGDGGGVSETVLLLLTNVVNETLLVQVTHLLENVAAKARRGQKISFEQLRGRAVLRAVSQCVSTYVCDNVVASSSDSKLSAVAGDSLVKMIRVVQLMDEISNHVLTQSGLSLQISSNRHAASSRTSVSATSLQSFARIPSQFVSLLLSMEYTISRFKANSTSCTLVSSQWAQLEPRLRETLQRCLEAKYPGASQKSSSGGDGGGYLLSRDVLAEISNHLPFPIGLVEDPGPLCSLFSEISVARMMAIH